MFRVYCKYHSEFTLQVTPLMVSGKHCFVVIIHSLWFWSFHPSSTIIPKHQVCVSSQGVRFNSNQKIFRYPSDSCITFIAVGISFQFCHYYSSQGSLLGKTEDYFSPLIVNITPSSLSSPIEMKLPGKCQDDSNLQHQNLTDILWIVTQSNSH